MAAYSKYGDGGGVRPYQVYVVSEVLQLLVQEIRPVPETCNGPSGPALITSIKESSSGIARFRTAGMEFYGDGDNVTST